MESREDITPTLAERLEKIKSPKLQNQKETAIVLSAVEETLKDQNYGQSPAGYFAALLALLGQAISSTAGIVNKELATSVAYLLDVVTVYVPAHLLRSKFIQILTSLAPVLTQDNVEAPLIRSSIGCLESLLVAQDGSSWSLPQTQIGPRRAVAGLLVLAGDHRPKVRKRAQEAISHVLQNPPPSPSLDHPVIDMCAETALRSVHEIASLDHQKHKKGKGARNEDHQPGVMHALQLVRAIASASGGWPSTKLDPLCEILLQISRSSNDYLTMMAFEIFEVVFAGLADEMSSSKLPRLMTAVTDLKPSQNDSQLLPPWIAIISRGYEVSAQIIPDETFLKLPEIFSLIADFLTSSSYNIRVSASECLISFLANCIPNTVILQPSVYDEKILEKVAAQSENLLSIKYQPAWMEVFEVLAALFSAFKWRSIGALDGIVRKIGDLRGRESFTGKKEADKVLGHAITAMGPETVLSLLPLNLAKPKAGQPGRAWLLPILRDNISNTHLAHFKQEFVPLSENMFQRVMDFGGAEKTMEIKIFETIIQQTWSLLPGYCNLPLDFAEAFDQTFAELLANLLYSQTGLRADICKALQSLVESFNLIIAADAPEEELLLNQRTSKENAQKCLNHLGSFAGNILAVLFNVYSQTLPQHRGYILQCIDAYLSITSEKELLETFERVRSMLDEALKTEAAASSSQRGSERSSNTIPPTSHTLTDLLITLSPYLPQAAFSPLFTLASQLLPLASDPQLQKKTYKLLPRLATSALGAATVRDLNPQLQSLILDTSATATAPTRRDRLAAIATIVTYLPPSDLHFIPSILSEVVLAAKEVNEKARTQAFDLLVLMARKMREGGIVVQARIPSMGSEAPEVQANLEEFFTMVSAGLAGGSPHVVAASVTSLTRILYEFASELSKSMIEDLVQTMGIFLTSANREIARAVLGFVKVAIISLPEDVIKPRLQQLVPGLMAWSKEHKARFRSKVKHILERLIRRFGVDLVEKCCPEDDKKLIHNIRKTKERNKRRKANAEDDQGEEGETQTPSGRPQKRQQEFGSAFDEALYAGDSSDSESSGSESSQHAPKLSQRRRHGGRNTMAGNDTDGVDGTYISNPPSGDPLDLLSHSSLAHISTQKPSLKTSLSQRRVSKKQRTDMDGKLIFTDQGDDATVRVARRKKVVNSNNDNDAMQIDPQPNGTAPNDEGLSLEEGINAYVDAIRGRDAVQRGRGGRLKYSNRRTRDEGTDRDGEAADGHEASASKSSGHVNGAGNSGKRVRFAAGTSSRASGGGTTSKFQRGGGTNGKFQRGGRGLSGRGGISKRVDRKGLGVGKVKAARVGKGR